MLVLGRWLPRGDCTLAERVQPCRTERREFPAAPPFAERNHCRSWRRVGKQDNPGTPCSMSAVHKLATVNLHIGRCTPGIVQGLS